MGYEAIWAALSLGLAGLGVTIWQGILAKTSVDILGRNPKLAATLRIYTIIGLALVESAAIYGLLIAWQILGATGLEATQAIGAWLVMWITAFGAGYWEGKLVASSLEAVNRNPENKTTVLQFMVLFLALLEAVAIYGLIISQKILG